MTDGTLIERVLLPRQTAPSAPPLLVLLHGIGADERDLLPLARALDPQFQVASLRAPHDYVVGYSWFPIDFRPGGEVVPDVPAARASLTELVRWLEAAPARLGTDPARTFLLGFSQGAMMSLGALLTAPERLAGVVALSGRFAPALFVPRASPEAIARVPVLAAHGLHDDVLPVAHGRGVRDALATRTTDLTYQEFPIGHEISPDELDLVARWLAARR
jgi:phospholipase/carboxylesterase